MGSVKAEGKMSKFSMAMTGLQIIDPILTYRSYRKEGRSAGSSALRAGASAVAWGLAPGVMTAWMMKDAVSGVAGLVMRQGTQNAHAIGKAYMSNFGGSYHDTQNAYTMRQAGVQAIQNSRLNTRSVLASEARLYQRATRDYGSY